MSTQQPDAGSLFAELGEDAIRVVRRWLSESAEATPDPGARRLAGLLADPRGLDFTLGFVDRVVRPEDQRVAARNLERLSRSIPSFLPWYERAAISFGGGFAPQFPWLVVPLARRVLRRMVGHLVVDASDAQLGATLARLRGEGEGTPGEGTPSKGTPSEGTPGKRTRLNLNLLGEAVLGTKEADRRLAGNVALLKRDDVDYVSIKVSAIASGLSLWGFDATVDRVVARLIPLYELAAAASTPKFINLDMEEFRDLDLTIAVFQRLLDQPQLRALEAGIVLQAYLPDALAALQRLTAWATARRAAGGAPIKVRLVKGANLAMERVDATLHGWPLATYSAKVDTDTNYKRVLDWALTPERAAAVHIGVAGHNLFDVAFAWLLAKRRGVEDAVGFEMLLGMATAQAEAVRRDVGTLVLYTPVVHAREFDSAISYLVRRLEENASSENFMSAVFSLADDAGLFQREADRFRASLAQLDGEVPASHRVQHREHAVAPGAPGAPAVAADDPVALEAPVAPTGDGPRGFGNERDTDPAIAANRAWGRRVMERSRHSTIGRATIAVARVVSADRLDRLIDVTARAGESWAQTPAITRSRLLHDVGDVLAAFRGRLVEVMAIETGKTIAEADAEVSEAVDFAHYYAERALDLDGITGARFVSPRLTVVAPPWNFPVAIPAGGVLAALAVGSGVILKPAPLARRSAAVLMEALWEAGVPQDLLTLIDVEEEDLGQQLMSSPQVDRVILTGAFETAQLFHSWRPELRLVGETSGKNAIIITPGADFDLAVADVVRSAFGHAGQKCSAASLVILVGTASLSDRFRRQLVDAVTSLPVGYPQDLAAQMGPLIEPAEGKLRSALTTLEPGERWLVTPRQLDDTGRLWSPGVRDGVAVGSAFHQTEYFGPVLGVMTADTLEDAIALQNGTDFGLTAGIHSLDVDEVERWLATVEAGNLYVNRGITGAIVQRQPFGGWKRSSVGTGAKAGGPNYLLALGDWAPLEAPPSDDLRLDGLSRQVSKVIKVSQVGMQYDEFDRVRRAAQNDEAAWVSEFGLARDVSGLVIERNVLRYRPAPVTLRLSEKHALGDLVRLIAAAARTRSPLTISSALPLPASLVELFEAKASPVAVNSVTVESDARWLERVRGGAVETSRIRLIGGDPAQLAFALGDRVDIAVYAGPVTTAGRIELLTFLREQSVSITAHRFGTLDPELSGLRL
ncbi:L-proline dehydrogenase [Glaciihabitans tibetensis]|uniref:L-glutamate gamma-semialdehyde dehydrogenase n=1 Tax=Glaciihabitans tibetensis TaxID=1266600 RepID=A0A2T0VCG8_9MICO|nr:proline dehydrogenase family protein [Glaciihabitans tibetensis]PRY67873.1 L-proline dehydrogenase [Glaciihabitans tibetensis]